MSVRARGPKVTVGLMLAFALTGGQKALWKIFATSNQLLAAMVLAIASLWLLRRRRSLWFAFVPGVLMMFTTVATLIIMVKGFLAEYADEHDTKESRVVDDLLAALNEGRIEVKSAMAPNPFPADQE